MRMEIERANDWRRFPLLCPNCPGEVALQVGRVDRRPRTVQAQQHPIEFARIGQAPKQFTFQFIINRCLNRATRTGAGVKQRHRLATGIAQHRQHPPDYAGVLGQQGFTGQPLRALESSAIRELRREVVALDEDTAYANPG